MAARKRNYSSPRSDGISEREQRDEEREKKQRAKSLVLVCYSKALPLCGLKLCVEQKLLFLKKCHAGCALNMPSLRLQASRLILSLLSRGYTINLTLLATGVRPRINRRAICLVLGFYFPPVSKQHFDFDQNQVFCCLKCRNARPECGSVCQSLWQKR